MEPTILIAEDDMVSRIALRRRLEGWGYPVVAVADGQAAWDLLDSEKAPPIAILDWTMPGLSGSEVLAQLRPLIPDEMYLPILVVTADFRAESMRQAFAGGVIPAARISFPAAIVPPNVSMLPFARTSRPAVMMAASMLFPAIMSWPAAMDAL